MNTSSPSPFSLPESAPELARRFCMILSGLAVLVARRFVRMPHLVGLTVLLWNRLSRTVPRFVRAMGQAATPPRARKRAARTARVSGPGLPSRRGWLLRELGWEAAAFTCQMENLLADPQMQALLAASPGLGRILRPLCRMLGVTPAEVPKIVVVENKAVAPPPPVWERAAGDGVVADTVLGVAAQFLPA